jgi:hypothetical protein
LEEKGERSERGFYVVEERERDEDDGEKERKEEEEEEEWGEWE